MPNTTKIVCLGAEKLLDELWAVNAPYIRKCI